MDPRNEINPHLDHYIGIDVGTGSARACIIDDKGDIVGMASENIGLWQPQQGYYVCKLSLFFYIFYCCDISLRETTYYAINANSFRNNLLRISGDASASLSSAPSASTTSMLSPSGELALTLPAL